MSHSEPAALPGTGEWPSAPLAGQDGGTGLGSPLSHPLVGAEGPREGGAAAETPPGRPRGAATCAGVGRAGQRRPEVGPGPAGPAELQRGPGCRDSSARAGNAPGAATAPPPSPAGDCVRDL